MAHEIESMVFTGEVPWHNLGVQVTDAPTIEQALQLSGLNWGVRTGTLTADNGQVARHKAIIRETDGSILGVVGPQYHPLQNKDAFHFFNPFVESGECSLETAGSLRLGARVWILAKLNRAPIEVTAGDIVNKYLLLSNSHDGTMAVRIGFTPIRVVCANTLAMADDSKQSQLIRVFHSRSVKANLNDVREAVNAANARFEANTELYKKLVKADVCKSDIEKYVTRVFFPLHDLDSERTKLSVQKMNETITRLFETGRGNDMAKVKGTWWALYNGATQYLSYEAGRQQDTRLNELWWGRLAKVNAEALNVAAQMAI